MSKRGSSDATLAAAAALAVVVLYRYRTKLAAMFEPTPTGVPGVPGSEGLSPRRVRALALVAEVVPSKYGDDKFARVAPGLKAETVDGKPRLTQNGVILPDNFTTCGSLPCFVGRGLGDPRGITQCGLEQIRIVAKKADAWVDAGGDRRPKPGDFFIVGNDAGAVLHVGVVIAAPATGPWKTADAGQGTKLAQEARYVERPYDPVAVTLGGPVGPRKLFGWLDLDRFPIADVKATGGGVAGVVVDVRGPREYRRGHVEGAVNIPVDDLRERLGELPKDRPVFVYCKSGMRSSRAAHLLEGMGFAVVNMGGWDG